MDRQTADTKRTSDPLSFSNVKATDMTIYLDGRPARITMYEGVYVLNPTNVAMVPDDAPDQRFSLYVPENADRHSPVVFLVKNWGWIMNAYQMRFMIRPGGAYRSDDPSDLIGRLMADGCVLLTYGCRSRGDRPAPDGRRISHMPATVTDTKALVRYLRYNRDLRPAGDPERIVITGTSGGGALSALIGASGNNAEFFPYLCEIGAAGIDTDGDRYCSTVRDDVFAVIAYCPINDLRQSDAAYEYTYGQVRRRLAAEGLPPVNPETGLTFQDPFTSRYTPEGMLEASDALSRQYAEYVDCLHLRDEKGAPITGENLREKMRELLNAGFRKAAGDIGPGKMKEDLTGSAVYSGVRTADRYNAGSPDWVDPFSADGDGVPFLADAEALQQYLYFVARNETLKVACAFSNIGLDEKGRAFVSGFNEDSLFGTEDQPYCPFEFWSWDHDAVKGNGVGLDDTGLTFRQYLETGEGRHLLFQLGTASPIRYLLREDGTASDICPHWYVRHGLRDRDTGFALQTVLYHALRSCDVVTHLDVAFTWLQPHCGDYDVPEAYAWLDSVLQEEEHTAD